MGFQIHVAATKNDWIDLFKETGGDEILRFYVSSAFSRESIVPMRLEDLPEFGIAKTGILVQEPHYLAIPATEQIVPREIRQNNGIVRYAVNELTNFDSLNFWPGGLWQDDYFVIGEISSIHKEGVVADLVKRMRRKMRKTFTFGGIYWATPECRSLYAHRTFTMDFRYPTAWK